MHFQSGSKSKQEFSSALSPDSDISSICRVKRHDTTLGLVSALKMQTVTPF